MRTRIKEISAADTWQIRHQVMWPNKPINYIKLDNDSQGKHYGLFIANKLIAVISIFIDNDKTQFRKFAVLKEYQGMGHGTALFNFVFKKIALQNIVIIWCNARKNKTNFYKRFGMEETKEEFFKGGIEYVIMEKKLKHQ